jgi:hypothetical protein
MAVGRPERRGAVVPSRSLPRRRRAGAQRRTARDRCSRHRASSRPSGDTTADSNRVPVASTVRRSVRHRRGWRRGPPGRQHEGQCAGNRQRDGDEQATSVRRRRRGGGRRRVGIYLIKGNPYRDGSSRGAAGWGGPLPSKVFRDSRHESVPPARNRCDELRIGRVVAKRAPKGGDVLRQTVFGNKGIRPHSVQQFVLEQEPIALLDEDEEGVKALGAMGMGSSPRRSRSEPCRNGPKWYTPGRGLVPSMPRDSTTRLCPGTPFSRLSAKPHQLLTEDSGLGYALSLQSARAPA